MKKFEMSERLRSLPPYIFSQINQIKAEATKKGIKLMSLGIGDPDQPTPGALVEKMKQAISKPENHLYSPYEGTEEFRKAVKSWMQQRFSVSLDADHEVMALIGSKEGLAHFPQAFLNVGDKAVFPSPGYPVFQTSILLAGAEAIPLPLLAEDNFLPDLNRLENIFSKHKPKYCLLNFPSNPTSALCGRDRLEGVVGLARKYGVILGYDNAYSEIYYDAKNRPPSILEIPGAKEVAIEFHSLSKTFNMTGWRLGYAVGNPELVAGLLKMKTNIDSGPLPAVQEVGSYALSCGDELTGPIRALYTERCKLVLDGLKRLGIEYMQPLATFFIWAKTPRGMNSMQFTKELIEKEGLVVTPGSGFGIEGEGFFRLAMTVPNEKINQALSHLDHYLKN